MLNNITSRIRNPGLARTPLFAAAPYSQRPTARNKGCQVDLPMRTKQALYVVEIKYRKSLS